jgi:hypothetical protein
MMQVMEKRCGRCGEMKPVDQFHRWKRGDGFQPWCKACRKAYDAAYSRRTLGRRRERRAERRVEFVAWYRALKESRGCADCGGRFPAEVMQWDHVPGADKVADVSNLLRRLCKRRVLEEIAKCELVCANCHAIRTVMRRGSRGVAQPG